MRKALSAAVSSAIVVAGLGWSSSASAAEEVTLREGDLSYGDTRATGHNDFLRDGIHVYTEGATSTDKAAGYFEIDGTLGDITNASMDWRNTPGFTAIPGQQIVFDADDTPDNGNDYNILVGEPVYTNDNGVIEWWLTNGSSQTAKDLDPSGANDGGNGSAYFGTLDQWAAALSDSTLQAGGYSLGSGVHGDGIVREMTYGDTTYTFTNEPEPNARPNAAFDYEVQDLTVSLDASTSSDADGDDLTYEWDLGNGETESGTEVEHSYAQAGQYTVKLTVNDGEKSDTATHKIVVTAAPLPTERPDATATITVPKRTVAKVNVRATQPEGTVPTPKGAFYRVLRTEKGAAADDVIEQSEIVSYLAKGRVREGSDDAHRFTFRKFAKVTVVSYGQVLADKAIPGKK